MTDRQAQLISKVVSVKLKYIYDKIEHYALAGEIETTYFSIGAATSEVIDLIKEDLFINNMGARGGVNNGNGYIKVYL